jgi:tRNA threonylcarbamoyladenosine biosynthesis protein TsaE
LEMESKEVDFGLDELNYVAHILAQELQGKPKLLLYGEMGAGKTTLVKELLRVLGSVDEVSSPSYSLINEYELKDGEIVRHIDLFRLETIEEALDIGMEDILYDSVKTIVEWPQLIESILDDNFSRVELTILSNGLRKVKIC